MFRLFLKSLPLGIAMLCAARGNAQQIDASPSEAGGAPTQVQPAPDATAPGVAEPAAPARKQDNVPPKDPERKGSLGPKLAEAVVPGRATFGVDRIADTALIGLSAGFGIVLEQINSTGEIQPQQIAPGFDRDKLIAIDRPVVSATPAAGAGGLSNIGLGVAIAYAAVDPVLSGYREQSVQTGLVDTMLYAESASLTLALTGLVKLAVRRPRPGAYQEAEKNKDVIDYNNPNTDSALSFFSGHASMTAALGATATYLAFTRSPSSWRPWVTLVAAAGVTTFVSIQRVRAGKHFPTDVIAGSVAGAGIGIIVPHVHRTTDVKQPRVWVGFAPEDARPWRSGGTLTLSGSF
jgi:hypothetical protein